MQYKTLVVCASATALAAALACSKNPETPVAPSSSQPGVADAAADGSTLKVSAPTPQSPVNEQQPDSLVLTAGKSTAYLRERDAALATSSRSRTRRNTTVCGPTVVGGGSGSTVSWTPSCTLEFDQPHTWRVQGGRQQRTRTVVVERVVPIRRGRLHPRQRSVRSADERKDRRQPLRTDHVRTERHHPPRSLEPRHLPPAGQPPGWRAVDDDPRRR